MKLTVRMELLSDTIFGSGFSLPGGADLSAKRDEEGYPYVSGATLKGLLRESLENICAWQGESQKVCGLLLGEAGYTGLESERRVQVTELVLETLPEDPISCYQERTFTALEDGVVKEGTLRTASCVAGGQVFTGALFCQEEDEALLRQGLQGIRYVGTYRSRGLGLVRCTVSKVETVAPTGDSLPPTGVIRYQLKSLLPLMLTDLNRSYANGYATRDYIPGTSVRGMVLSELAGREPAWFESNKRALLTEVCFLDALPCPEDWEPLPPIMGFYGEKSGNTVVKVLEEPEKIAGKKRVSLGTCACPKGDTIYGYQGKVKGTMRIKRQTDDQKDARPFQIQYLEAGQNFTGYILLRNPQLAPVLGEVFQGDVWLGADRHSGFGQCQVTACTPMEQPGWLRYSYGPEEEVGQELYLLAVTPLGCVNQYGEPCGLDTEALAEALEVEQVELVACATALREFAGFNRTWQCGLPHQRMYDRGSLFRLRCSQPPSPERLRALQHRGFGSRRAEGFGQILFLSPACYKHIGHRQMVEAQKSGEALGQVARRRQERSQWLMEHHATVHSWGLSNSQVGTLQSFCQQGREALLEHLQHNLENRGAAHREKYAQAVAWIQQLLSQPPLGLAEGQVCALLSELLDHSRKENG